MLSIDLKNKKNIKNIIDLKLYFYLIVSFFLLIGMGFYAGNLAHAANATAHTEHNDAFAFPKTVEVNNQTLKLNGSAIRTRHSMQLYAIALYTNEKTKNADDIFQINKQKRIAISPLRDIDTNDLSRLFVQAIHDNVTRHALIKIAPDLMRIGELFSEQTLLKTNDSFTIDWIPGNGAIITSKGVVIQKFQEPELFKSLLSIWLGLKPVDSDIKESLLGIKEEVKNSSDLKSDTKSP